MNEDFSIPDALTDDIIEMLKKTDQELLSEDAKAMYADSVKIPREVVDIILRKELHTLSVLEKYVMALTTFRNSIVPISQEEAEAVAETLTWVADSVHVNALMALALRSLKGFADDPPVD